MFSLSSLSLCLLPICLVDNLTFPLQACIKMEFLGKEVTQLSNDKAALNTANKGLISDNQSISQDLSAARREVTKLEAGRESLL